MSGIMLAATGATGFTPVTRTYNSGSGTENVPTGALSCVITLWGAGGDILRGVCDLPRVRAVGLRVGKGREEMEREPKSDWARYAFGYSDKKPGASFWIIHGAMVALIIMYGLW